MTSLAGKHILLCEDHYLSAAITIKTLEHAGILVTRAGNGEDGLKIFSDSPVGFFDAIIMDIVMPHMNGLDAARKLRELQRSDAATVPIIAMTAKFIEEDRKKSIASGMDAHLSKPADPTQLYSVIGSLIEDRQKRRTQI